MWYKKQNIFVVIEYIPSLDKYKRYEIENKTRLKDFLLEHQNNSSNIQILEQYDGGKINERFS